MNSDDIQVINVQEYSDGSADITMSIGDNFRRRFLEIGVLKFLHDAVEAEYDDEEIEDSQPTTPHTSLDQLLSEFNRLKTENEANKRIIQSYQASVSSREDFIRRVYRVIERSNGYVSLEWFKRELFEEFPNFDIKS